MPTPLKDMVIILPGITGTVLEKNGTDVWGASKEAFSQILIESALSKVSVVTVNEQNSTLEARDRYWEMYPPKKLQRLIPQGLRVPPRPVDDIVAILLIERYLEQSS